MEYLEGLNLSEVIAGGPLNSERAAGIAVQLCEFLEAAHGSRSRSTGALSGHCFTATSSRATSR